MNRITNKIHCIPCSGPNTHIREYKIQLKTILDENLFYWQIQIIIIVNDISIRLLNFLFDMQSAPDIIIRAVITRLPCTRFLWSIFVEFVTFCFVVAMCNLVHGIRIIHDIW